MAQRLLIRDLTLRDGQQSQFATRMTQNQVDRVLPFYKKARFYAMEVWGGAVPDSVMRFLNENPWTRLESIRDGVAGASKLTALSRGRNLFGYNPYPDSVIEGFCRNSVRSGIDIMRVFDALNDIDNMTSTIRFVKENGGMADCAVCYTVDPKFSTGERFRAFIRGKKIPGTLFGIPYFVRKAKELAAAGADMITIKDMAGLVDPATSAKLIKALKSELGVPIDLHTHCTPGFGTASILMAMVNGVDIVDTVIMNFSGGPAAPAYEIVQLLADRLGIDTGVDKAAVADINRELRGIRGELAKFDQSKLMPPEIDLTTFKPGKDLGDLLDGAVEAAVAGKTELTLKLCQSIETAFNYPEPNEIVKRAQIPGGMYTNMMAQLQEYKLEQYVEDVLQIVPQVRLDAGVPPLVTPTSQIVGAQAVNCIVDKSQGKPFYTNVSKNFIELVKGSYGRTPFPVDPAFREKIAGVRQETPYDTSKYKKQPNPALEDCGGLKLAANEKEELLLELFPSVADKYLQGARKAEWDAYEAARIASLPPEPEALPARYPAAFWEEQLTLATEA
ncbi:MAG: carboxylase [Spirochaetia bacterium]|jgi:pyruvate/oxaloacetate carboxyltransferase|nr:carboxylase [Spirochaetia bacterium]